MTEAQQHRVENEGHGKSPDEKPFLVGGRLRRRGRGDRRLGYSGVIRLEREPIFPASDDDALRLFAAGTAIELFQSASELVDIDAHHRVLCDIELGAATERLDGDVNFLRGLSLNGAFDEVIEQAAQLSGATQQTTGPDPVGTRGKLFGIQHVRRGAPPQGTRLKS